MDNLEQRFVDAGDATLEIFTGGAGQPVVVRAHALVEFTEAGDALSRALADSYRVMFVNARGKGRSSPSPVPNINSYSHLADDLEAVRKRLEIERWVVTGDAGGAGTALLYALRYPAALAGLIVGFGSTSASALLNDQQSVLSPFHPDNAAAITILRQTHSSAAHSESDWIQLVNGRWLWIYQGKPTIVWPYDMSESVKDAWAEILTFDVQDRLHEIRVPALVFAGRHDELIPVHHVEAIAKGIRDAEFFVLESSDHGPVDADFERYRTILQRFIRERICI